MASKRKTKNIGPLIRAARMARGLTQRDLAEKLGAGSAPYIGMLEAGLTSIGAERLQEIASILGLSSTERNRWMAAAEHVPAPLWNALMKNPDRWDDVLALLGKSSSSSKRASNGRASNGRASTRSTSARRRSNAH